MNTAMTLLPLLAQAVTPETVQVDWIDQLRQGGLTVVVQGLLVVALIALPALLAHHLFKRKLPRIAKTLEMDLELLHRR